MPQHSILIVKAAASSKGKQCFRCMDPMLLVVAAFGKIHVMTANHANLIAMLCAAMCMSSFSLVAYCLFAKSVSVAITNVMRLLFSCSAITSTVLHQCSICLININTMTRFIGFGYRAFGLCACRNTSLRCRSLG